MSSYPIKHSPDAEFRFFVFDPNEGDFTYYRSAEDRDQGAEAVIQTYLDDGWDEMVEQVVAGEMTHFCGQTGRVDRPADIELDENGCDGEGTHWGDWQYTCNYDLLPLPAAEHPLSSPLPSQPSVSLIELMESRRIAMTPEHEGGWHTEVYDDAARPLYQGYGLNIDEAITAALSPDAEPLAHQGVPGTSYQRLNALANQGE